MMVMAILYCLLIVPGVLGAGLLQCHGIICAFDDVVCASHGCGPCSNATGLCTFWILWIPGTRPNNIRYIGTSLPYSHMAIAIMAIHLRRKGQKPFRSNKIGLIWLLFFLFHKTRFLDSNNDMTLMALKTARITTPLRPFWQDFFLFLLFSYSLSLEFFFHSTFGVCILLHAVYMHKNWEEINVDISR